MRLIFRSTMTLVLGGLMCLPLFGAAKSDKESDKPFGDLSYRLIGPNVGGRIAGVAGVPGDPLVAYFAAAQGGLWKTENGGLNFSPIFDGEMSQSLGSIAIAPSDANVLYVGGGEANPRGNVMIGHGIWKSLDAGKTWQHVFKTKGQIGRIIVHPRDAKIAFAAVLGSPFASNADRGVYRTLDGGKTWQQVLKKDADTGASDVSFDPNNANVLFAGMWQMRRSPWNNQSGGPGSGLYRSNDGGDTWTQLKENGLPEGVWGKVGVAIAPSDSNRVYALIEANEGGLFRSDDGGEKWERINAHRALRQRAWYYSVLTIDPSNADVIWVPQVPLLKSIDGGKSFTQVQGPSHGDHHDLWIDPRNNNRIITGHDGGVDLSVDGGKTWFNPPLPLAQFYNIDVDDRWPYHVGGTMQDMGTASGPAWSLAGDKNTLASFHYVGGGEAADFVFDRSQEGAVYAGEYGGYLSHHVEGTGQFRNITIWPSNPSGIKPQDYKYRFQWTAPLADSPHDPKVIYHGANVLFKSTDQGATWKTISPDLTRNDKSKQGWSGGPITGDITGVETYNTIFSIAESKKDAGTIWVGTDDGLVQLTRDGGATWQNITPKNLPAWATVEAIEPMQNEAGGAYVVVHNYRLGDDRPYLYVTRDFGKSWKTITQGIAEDLFLWTVKEDPTDGSYLYLGTSRGMKFSSDAGATWQDFSLNLPPVAITDLEVRHGDLIVATRGRALWVLENLAQVRALASARTQALALLPTREAIRYRTGYRYDGDLAGAQDNPAFGANLAYWLKGDVKGDLKLEIFDANNQLIRTLSSVIKPPKYGKDDPDEPSDAEQKAELDKTKGVHLAQWDLRHEGARRLNAKLDAGNPERGPLALPGRYRLRLSGDEFASESFVEIKMDPRSTLGLVDLKANLDFALENRALLNRATDSIETLQAIQQQAKDLRERSLNHADRATLLIRAEAVLKRCEAIENDMHNPKAQVVYDVLAGREGGAKLVSQLSPLYSWAQDADHAPSQGLRERQAELKAELVAREAAIAQLQSSELAQLEQAVADLKLPRILLPKRGDK